VSRALFLEAIKRLRGRVIPIASVKLDGTEVATMSFEEYKEKIGSIEEKIASSGKERGAMFDNFKARLNELQEIIAKNKTELEDYKKKTDSLESENSDLRMLLEKTVDLLRRETEEGVDGELRDLDTQIDLIFNLAGPEQADNVETLVKDEAPSATPTAEPADPFGQEDGDSIDDMIKRFGNA
jgi:DNA repair exonuclease SbcCD ATPase subunit